MSEYKRWLDSSDMGVLDVAYEAEEAWNCLLTSKQHKHCWNKPTDQTNDTDRGC